MSSQKLPLAFYRQDDVVSVAKQLVGKVLCTKIGGSEITSGVIMETEAYCGRDDKASHANDGTRTDRTEIMYHEGGVSYVYLCYGIHHLFNVVTNIRDHADAVLIRSVKPLDGSKTMRKRRGSQTPKITPALTAGPGRLTQALGITTDYDATPLTGDTIWIEDRGLTFAKLKATPRIGVDYAGDNAKLPWRFYPKGSSWISKK